MEAIFGFLAEQLYELLKSEGPKKLNTYKLKNSFIQMGRFIGEFEAGDQESFETEIKLIFSKENMKELFKDVKKTPGFYLINDIRSKLATLCEQYEVSPEDTNNFIDSFIAMITEIIVQTDDNKAVQMFLRDAQDNIIEHNDDNTEIILSAVNGIKEEFNRMMIPDKEKVEVVQGEVVDTPVDESDEIKWNLQHVHIDGLFGDEETRKMEMRLLTRTWKTERENYPGWIVPSYIYRERLRTNTVGDELLQNKELLPLNEMFDFTYELLWRYEIGVMLYSRAMQINALNIWEKAQKQGFIQQDENVLDKWLEIGLYFLREFREELDREKWDIVFNLMKEQADGHVQIQADMKMEALQMNFAEFRIVEVINQINTMSIDKKSFLLRLKLCSLRALCGMQERSLDEINQLVIDINYELRRTPSNTWLLSVAACTYQLKAYLLQAIKLCDQNFQSQINECFEKCKQLNDYFSFDEERDVLIAALFEWREKNNSKPLFELNRETITIISSSNECWEAYGFYRIMSIAAIPFRLGCVSIIGKGEEAMIDAIMEICPELGWQLMIQSGNKKAVEKCLTRKSIVGLNRKNKNKLFKLAYDALDNNIPGICGCRDVGWKDRNIFSYIAASTIPMLTRLASIALSGQQLKLIVLLIKLIDTDAIHEYRVLEPFMSIIMRQANENSKADMLNALLECSAKSRFHIEQDGQLDPFDVFTFKKQTLPMFESKTVDPNIIKELFVLTEKTKIERNVAFARLGQLSEWGKLTKDQENRFGDALWSKVNPNTQFPDMENYYIFVFMRWPHPCEIDVESRLRNYFVNEERIQKIIDNFHIRTVQSVPFYDELYNGLIN